MRRLSLAALALMGACAPGQLFHRGPTPNRAVEAEYAAAVAILQPDTTAVALDSAVALLDAYLAYTGYVKHRDDAAAMRALASQAQRLVKVEAALREARANAGTHGDASGSARADDDAVREIQRLKEELAKANAELERIRKRLATPKP